MRLTSLVPGRRLRQCAAAAVVLALAAGCSSLRPVEWRLVGRTTADVADPNAFAQRLAAIAGQPLSADSPRFVSAREVSFTLQCADRGHCKRAMMKLATAPGLFAELSRESVNRLPNRPLPGTTS